MMRKYGLLVLMALACIVISASKPEDLVSYVNTLQGTNSRFELTRGNTYPTTALPFGMHTWTPQTGVNGDGWKYQYFLDSIRGFQQAHRGKKFGSLPRVMTISPPFTTSLKGMKRAFFCFPLQRTDWMY